MEKTCKSCNSTKPISDFYKHPKTADGHLSSCKECKKKDATAVRNRRIEYYRDYDRKRRSRRTSEENRNYRTRKKKAYWARSAVSNAVRDGTIVKKTYCESCGDVHKWIHAHHDDYDRPLTVRWLCPPCHFAWHLKNGEGKNAT